MIMPRGEAGRDHVMFTSELDIAMAWGRIADSPSGARKKNMNIRKIRMYDVTRSMSKF